MPTLRSEDCVSDGSGGDSGDSECEGGLGPEVMALRWKNEWIGGWYWRLRVCSSEAIDGAIVWCLCSSVSDLWCL
jgi:hypothetical protein